MDHSSTTPPSPPQGDVPLSVSPPVPAENESNGPGRLISDPPPAEAAEDHSNDNDNGDDNGNFDNNDTWSRHVETDASERGRLSTTTSLMMDDDDDDNKNEVEGGEESPTTNYPPSANHPNVQHHHHNDDDDDDDDDGMILHHHHEDLSNQNQSTVVVVDDDDNWSRQVETDETVVHRTSSSMLDDHDSTAAGSHGVALVSLSLGAAVMAASAATTTGSSTIAAENENENENDDDTGLLLSAAATSAVVPVAPPLREEPTLKEKLVERERQRRVETERARLKRQFALRSNAADESLAEDDEDDEYPNHHHHNGRHGHHGEGYQNDYDDNYPNNLMRENGSVAGTVGEGSIVAPVDVLLEDDAHKQMNYPMERFLQEQGTIAEEENNTHREPMTVVMGSSGKRDTQNQGVVMERFLQEKIVVEQAPSSPDEAIGNNNDHPHDHDDDHRQHHHHHRHQPPSHVDRSVSFDMDPPNSPPPGMSPGQSGLIPPTSVGGESIPEEVTTSPPHSVSASHNNNNNNRADYDDGTPDGDYRIGDAATSSTGIHTPRGENSSYLGNASMDCVTSEVARISDLGRPDISLLPDVTIDTGNIILPPSSPPREQNGDELSPESPTMDDQPRVLGLTQAEIEELEAIEEVSQQNAPPSERDDLSASSFVAELVSDFGGGHGMGLDHQTTLSQGTPTTAMESASILSGNQSAQRTVSETAEDDDHHRHHQHRHHQNMDELENASVNSNLGDASSSDGGGVSVTANPPSELGHEDTLLSPLADLTSSPMLDDQQQQQRSSDNHIANNAPSMPRIDQAGSSGPDHHHAAPTDLSDLATFNNNNAGIVNRQIRPGMITASQAAQFRREQQQRKASSPVRRVMSMPDTLLTFDDVLIDGFDYDKDAPRTPSTDQFARIADVSPDNNMLWSPGSKLSIERSPFRPRVMDDLPHRSQLPPTLQQYGTHPTTRGTTGVMNQSASETDQFLPDIPSEIVTNNNNNNNNTPRSATTTNKANLKDDTPTSTTSGAVAAVVDRQQQQDIQQYNQISPLQRAFPDRLLGLAATFLVEIPVLLMIAGGSDRLYFLLGRSTYQLLMGLLPFCSAIAGSVGLQTSALTVQGLAYGQITRNNFTRWLIGELGTTAYLGLATGVIVGLVAFVLSGFQFLFGVTIVVAQGISIIVAGLTGAVPPLFCSFVLGRSPPKWNGIVETAVQDVISTMVMVMLAYKLLELGGPAVPSSALDTCEVAPPS